MLDRYVREAEGWRGKPAAKLLQSEVTREKGTSQELTPPHRDVR
jgi:hypothetical protein